MRYYYLADDLGDCQAFYIGLTVNDKYIISCPEPIFKQGFQSILKNELEQLVQAEYGGQED
jgi:hypothetical protein